MKDEKDHSKTEVQSLKYTRETHHTMLAKTLVMLVLATPAVLAQINALASVLEFAEYDSEQSNPSSEVLERPIESKLDNINVMNQEIRNKVNWHNPGHWFAKSLVVRVLLSEFVLYESC